MKGSQLTLGWSQSDRVSKSQQAAESPQEAAQPRHECLAPGAMLLHGFALSHVNELLADLERILSHAPPRHMVTPGGLAMSAAMTNCGPLGWISDRSGYRYSPLDPTTGKPWPALPSSFLQLAQRAAQQAGFVDFVPDACLINCYAPGSKLTLHQDRNEHDFRAPIVSVSLGLPATFLFGGLQRRDRTSRHLLQHGDVVAWGGPSRLRFHGILPIKPGDFAPHPLLTNQRINLTLRRAG